LITLLDLKDISISNLSEKMGLDGSTMSRNIGLLYRKGLVDRFRDEETDRRIVYVKLSEAGKKLPGMFGMGITNGQPDYGTGLRQNPDRLWQRLLSP